MQTTSTTAIAITRWRPRWFGSWNAAVTLNSEPSSLACSSETLKNSSCSVAACQIATPAKIAEPATSVIASTRGLDAVNGAWAATTKRTVNGSQRNRRSWVAAAWSADHTKEARVSARNTAAGTPIARGTTCGRGSRTVRQASAATAAISTAYRG